MYRAFQPFAQHPLNPDQHFPAFEPQALISGDYQHYNCGQWAELIAAYYLADEEPYLQQLSDLVAHLPHQKASLTGAEHIRQLRAQQQPIGLVDRLMREYSLNNDEGLILLVLAEALLRTPDEESQDALIRAQMCLANWDVHIGHADSFWVNAATQGLKLGQEIALLNQPDAESIFGRWLGHAGEPLVRAALIQGMELLSQQYVIGETIQQALAHIRQHEYQPDHDPHAKQPCFSFDMLGEEALTEADAERYFRQYLLALNCIASFELQRPDKTEQRPSVSLKLSALHPRYEESQRPRVLTELGQKLTQLVTTARKFDIALCIDAEECDRLELSLTLFEQVMREHACGWGKLGLAVQAYSKRALPTLAWIDALSRECQTTIPVRLVKGAYWDSEIKHAQQLGLNDFPVFRQKCHTDISYMACAFFMIRNHQQLQPQFGTHNAYTIEFIRLLCQREQLEHYEFQRLYGMADVLYQRLPEEVVRVYAPIGNHQELLPYLVRRLLENGANSSFVHHQWDEHQDPDQLVRSPLLIFEQAINQQSGNEIATLTHQSPLLAKPPELYCNETPPRQNSGGTNLASACQRLPFEKQLAFYLSDDVLQQMAASFVAGPLLADALSHPPEAHTATAVQPVTVTTQQKFSQQEPQLFLPQYPQYSPTEPQQVIGTVQWLNTAHCPAIVRLAQQGYDHWQRRDSEQFARLRNHWLLKLADELQKNQVQLVALCILECGKTRQDAIAEVREAIDFCHYYAAQISQHFLHEVNLSAPAGENNKLYYRGRGVVVTISPWNFPLAIFIGQISAAIAAGNSVLAKPAEAATLIAFRATELAYNAGIPRELLQLLPGEGEALGNGLLTHPLVRAVAFTGSCETAHRINQILARKPGPLTSFIAETGGQNAMIADSTALPEQVAKDALQSAFNSAGQRCSALRVLFVQHDIAPRVIQLLQGMISQLQVGTPLNAETDIGPIINRDVREALTKHIRWLEKNGRFIAHAEISSSLHNPLMFAPCIYEIDSIDQLDQEHFGPILHIVRFHADEIDAIVDDINNTGFGLTLSVHSRNPETVQLIEHLARVGNIYINRNQIGAVVGCQPFGGMGMSGSGPKAGGPNYVLRFAQEVCRSENTAALGGSTDLLSIKK